MRATARESTALAPSVVLLSAAAACTYLYRTDPHEPGHLLPLCPFRWLTGWQCPLCGGTRLAYDVLHGAVARAWHDNALLLIVSPFLLALLGGWVVAGWSGRRFQVTLPRYGGWLLLAVALPWMVLRNLA